MKTGKAIKKPIPVEFIRLDSNEQSIFACYRFVNGEGNNTLTSDHPMAQDAWDNFKNKCIDQGFMPLKTLESGQGTQNANFGDYILKGIDGECWPIKADIFERTYDIIPQ